MLETTGYLPRGPSAATALFHWVAKTDEGIRIVDVWESRQAFDRFASTADPAVFARAGAPEPPVIQFFEVHNYLTGGYLTGGYQTGGRWRG